MPPVRPCPRRDRYCYAFPIAAGVFYPAFGLMLRPEIGAIAMSGSSLIVAVNALLLKNTQLDQQGVKS